MYCVTAWLQTRRSAIKTQNQTSKGCSYMPCNDQVQLAYGSSHGIIVPVKIKRELRNLPTTVRSKHVDLLTPQLRGCLACSSGDAHRASLSVSKLPKRDADVTKTCSAKLADGISNFVVLIFAILNCSFSFVLPSRIHLLHPSSKMAASLNVFSEFHRLVVIVDKSI